MDPSGYPLFPPDKNIMFSILRRFRSKLRNYTARLPRQQNKISPHFVAGFSLVAATAVYTTIVPLNYKIAKWQEPPKLSAELYQYLLKLGIREPGPLEKLRLETSKHEYAKIMATPEESALFTMLLKLISAKKAIEIGVFTGYSTLAIALGLSDDGKVVALDITDEYPKIGKPFWKEAKVDHKIDFRVGPAVDSLDKMLNNGEKGTYDFAFIDADKENIDRYYEQLLLLVRKGGLIAIDNVLWHGRVVDPMWVNDTETVAILALNLKLRDDPRVEIVMLPIADGVTFCHVL